MDLLSIIYVRAIMHVISDRAQSSHVHTTRLPACVIPRLKKLIEKTFEVVLLDHASHYSELLLSNTFAETKNYTKTTVVKYV